MTALFSLAIFLGAALLFVVQPMIGKMILPRLGGSPAVWNTCLVFFQGALLVGYLYAHALDRVRWRAVQVGVHALVLLLPAATLPMVMPVAWEPLAGESRPIAILRLLIAMTALPFCVVATTGPLLQRWYSLTGAAGSRDPYFLYAASNTGSLIGLLAYPLLIEPTITLGAQSKLWAIGYALYALLAAACGVMVLHRGAAAIGAPAGAPEAPGAATPSPAGDVGLRAHLRWLVLAAVPSSLVVGSTQYISTDIAAIPLLWVVPLALYLITFVIAFSRRPLPQAVSAAGLVLCAIIAGIVQIAVTYPPIPVILGLHLGVLFFGAMVCHMQLSAIRPAPRSLTRYYLFISLGGVLGGSFNALLAPVAFSSLWEYPIAIVAACLLITLPGGLAPALRGVARAGRVVVVVAVAGLMLAGIIDRDYKGVIHRERTFFGIHAVESTPSGVWHTLRHGTTKHGVQKMIPEADQRVPRSYYHAQSPIGWMFRTAQDPEYFGETVQRYGAAAAGRQPMFRRVALVGMGTATLLTYAQPGDEFSIYEIDPAVDRIARNPAWFTYVRTCEGRVTTVIGDGRLRLAEAPDASFDLIVLDAFSSDAIPYHLLTQEAVQMYLRRLAPGGVIAVHISNRHLDLGPVVAAGAHATGAAAIIWRSSASNQGQALSESVWCAVAQRPEDLRVFTLWPETWRPLQPPPGYRPWTDDYSNLLRALTLN